MQGARAASRILQAERETGPVSACVVWIPMLPEDSKAAAVFFAQEIFPPGAARHFYDPQKRCGQEIARGLGWEGVIGWDMYLVYAPGAVWLQTPPRPAFWAHQLTSSRMVEPDHYHTGPDLERELRRGIALKDL